MISTSTEFDNLINESKVLVLGAEIIFPDSTMITLDDSDIMQGGMEFDSAVSGDRTFQVGAAIIGKCTIQLDNSDNAFDEYEFTDAQIIPTIGMQLSSSIETIQKGYYTVDESTFIGNIVRLECLDNMHKFEIDFANVPLSFPCTALYALQTICTYCGVVLDTSSFTNSGYIIQSRPDDAAMTCIDIVSYIAQISGCFARVNNHGSLELKWYDTEAFEQTEDIDGGIFDDGTTSYTSGGNIDGGTFNPWTIGDSADGGTLADTKRFHHLFNFGATPTIGIDDIVITGVKIENTNSENGYTAMYGVDGYTIGIIDNPLIQSHGDATTLINAIGAKIVGMKFRQFSCSTLSNPAIDAGDIVNVSVRTRNGFITYESYITGLSYKVGSREQIKCVAESPSRNTSKRYGALTKNIVKVRNESIGLITAYDLIMQQFTNLMSRGYGLYPTEEIQQDGSTIYYMHNQPTIAASSSVWKFNENGIFVSTDHGLTWGVDTNGNMLVNVLTAKGINADWINAGTITGITIETNSGKIGPFNIGANGLFSDIIEIYEDTDYPLIWLTKKGPNGEEWGSDVNGTQRANYEPAVAAVRSVEEGIQTDITLMARVNPVTGKTGEIQIYRSGIGASEKVVINTEGLILENYANGDLTDHIVLNSNGLIAKNQIDFVQYGMYDGGVIQFDGNDVYINAVGSTIRLVNGELNISWNGGSITSGNGTLYINANDDVYINGTSIEQMQTDIATINSKLYQLGILP